MLFEELGDGGVADDAVGVFQHIVALVLEDQILHLLSGGLKLLASAPAQPRLYALPPAPASSLG